MDSLIVIEFSWATCYFYGISKSVYFKCDCWYILPVYHTFKTKIKIGKNMQYENNLRKKKS